MITPEIRYFLNLAEESHGVAGELIKLGSARFSAAQSYYTMFYLAEALLMSKNLTFSSHSAIIASFGKEFAKTQLLDPKFHRYLIRAQKLREIGHYGDADDEVLMNKPWNRFSGRVNFCRS